MNLDTIGIYGHDETILADSPLSAIKAMLEFSQATQLNQLARQIKFLPLKL